MKVLFFDGECVMCNGAAHWVAKQDNSGQIKFASLQGAFAKKHLNGLENQVDSLIFIDDDLVFIKSEAFFELLKYLGAFRFLRILLVFPKGFRDFVYDWVAKNRIKWFGKKDYCEMPPSKFRGRYIPD